MTDTSKKLNRTIGWAVILTECSHVFCCVLPTVITVLSILASFGTVTQIPTFMLDIHEALHAYEIPIILFSGTMMILGWVLYGISRKIECQKPHCEPHETVCTPAKDRTKLILQIASVLFAVNVIIYFTLHVGFEHYIHRDHDTHMEHQDHHHD